MSPEIVDPLALAVERFGEPEATYRVGGRRFGVKLALGSLLITYGVAANVLAWTFGVWAVEHWTILALFAPPLMGVSLLRQLYAGRGVAFHVYPEGLLFVRRGEVRAVRWDEVTAVKVRAEQAAGVAAWDGRGRATDAWLAVTAPVVRLGTAAVELAPADGPPLTLTPVVADYPGLVEEVLSRTFAVEWPRLLAALAAGQPYPFGPWAATAGGLVAGGAAVPWGEFRAAVVGGQMALSRGGSKPVQYLAPLESISFPQLLVALVGTGRPAAAE